MLATLGHSNSTFENFGQLNSVLFRLFYLSNFGQFSIDSHIALFNSAFILFCIFDIYFKYYYLLKWLNFSLVFTVSFVWLKSNNRLTPCAFGQACSSDPVTYAWLVRLFNVKADQIFFCFLGESNSQGRLDDFFYLLGHIFKWQEQIFWLDKLFKRQQIYLTKTLE